MKGQLPLGFLVLKAGVNRRPEEIVHETIDLVRERIGPVAAFKLATVVKRLPKTRSGKILRGTMQKIADGEAYKTPATIDDPAILPEIGDALRAIGYAKRPACARRRRRGCEFAPAAGGGGRRRGNRRNSPRRLRRL